MEPFEDLPALTDKQKAVLEEIYHYWASNRFYPTQREISKKFAVSLAAIQTSIGQLIKKEYLVKINDRGHRNIRLSKKAGIVLGVSGHLGSE